MRISDWGSDVCSSDRSEGIGDVLYPDVVLEPAARHALILAGPDQFDAAPIATLVVGPRLDGADRCLLGQVEFGGGGLHEFPILWRQVQTTPRNVIQLAEGRKPGHQAQPGYGHGCEKSLPHA